MLIIRMADFIIMLDSVFLYLDPGSGSVIAQIIIAAIVGAGISLKVFWVRITSKFRRIS